MHLLFWLWAVWSHTHERAGLTTRHVHVPRPSRRWDQKRRRSVARQGHDDKSNNSWVERDPQGNGCSVFSELPHAIGVAGGWPWKCVILVARRLRAWQRSCRRALAFSRRCTCARQAVACAGRPRMAHSRSGSLRLRWPTRARTHGLGAPCTITSHACALRAHVAAGFRAWESGHGAHALSRRQQGASL